MDLLLEKIPVTPLLQNLIGVAVIILATALVSVILRSVLFAVIGRLTHKTSTTLDDRLLKGSKNYIALLVYVFGLSVLFNFIESRYAEYIGNSFVRVIDGIIYGAGVFIVALLLVRIVSAVLGWYSETVAVRTETTLDDEFMPLLDRSFKIIAYILAVLIVLDHYGIDVKGLVAVLGVGSLAVALAAQDTLANMIGGFTLMIDRPFRVGDMVRLPDNRRVTVYEIGIRSTKFLTFDHTLVIVPNAELIKSTVHNITYPKPRVRIVVDVGVGYDSEIEKVREVMIDEAIKHDNIMANPKPQFFFLNFGDSSLDVSLRCHVARAEDHRRTSSELRMAILNRFRVEGIEIPFPQRVITMVQAEPVSD
ncbi:MAG: mechanosensitive ion channel [FCB group bacterium]|nr:mechanosensitive ion channel [FCB group bacterium]